MFTKLLNCAEEKEENALSRSMTPPRKEAPEGRQGRLGGRHQIGCRRHCAEPTPSFKVSEKVEGGEEDAGGVPGGVVLCGGAL